jgi:hypothetical protein
MSKTIWIRCKQVVEYSQQHTVTDEEYELIKDLDMDDVGNSGNTKKVYDVINAYIDPTEVTDCEEEYTDVQVTED